MSGKGVPVPSLVTSVQRLEYDYESQRGILYMPTHCCTDMGGAVRLFQHIDPKVRVIYTFAGQAEDTVYFKERSGLWSAITSRLMDQNSALSEGDPRIARGRPGRPL